MVRWRTSISQLILAFFGLTLEYRGNVFTQIHEILFYGQGGYDYETIYNMPLWLRRFTYNKIHEYYEKKNEKTDNVDQSIKNMKAAGSVANNKVQVPTYVTKASKK
jgi:hypothetical protein